jgi:hypothetical protein
MSAQTDRELLELAAKAIGLPVRWDDLHQRFFESRVVKENGGLFERDWIPLDDDGDALRLVAHLTIDICWDNELLSVSADDCVENGWSDDSSASLRRAIVRAAAAIEMP